MIPGSPATRLTSLDRAPAHPLRQDGHGRFRATTTSPAARPRPLSVSQAHQGYEPGGKPAVWRMSGASLWCADKGRLAHERGDALRRSVSTSVRSTVFGFAIWSVICHAKGKGNYSMILLATSLRIPQTAQSGSTIWEKTGFVSRKWTTDQGAHLERAGPSSRRSWHKARPEDAAPGTASDTKACPVTAGRWTAWFKQECLLIHVVLHQPRPTDAPPPHSSQPCP